MTWAGFKLSVKDLLTVDTERLGTETFIDKHIRAAVQDLLHFIKYYQADFVRTLTPDEFATEGYASRAKLEAGLRLQWVDILRREQPEAGTANGCVQWNSGTNRLKDENDYADLSSGPVTFECWSKVSASQLITIAGSLNMVQFASTAQMFYLCIVNPTAVAGAARLKTVFNFPVTPITLLSTSAIVPDVWNHYAVVWADSQIKLYINGVLDATANTTEATLTPPVTEVINYGFHYRGKLDELKLWNTARTAADFENRFADSADVHDGMVAYFKLNEGTGTTAENLVTEEDIAFTLLESPFASWSTDHFPAEGSLLGDFIRHPCVNVAWNRRHDLINNLVLVNDNNGRIALAPNGRDLYLYPKLVPSDDEEMQMLAEITYDTDSLTFDDADTVPFDEPMASAVADWVKGEIARHVDRDMGMYASFLAKPGTGSRLGGSYYQKRTQLYLRAKEMGQVADDGNTGSPSGGNSGSGCCGVSASGSSSSSSTTVNNITTGNQVYIGAFTDPNGNVTGSVGDLYKSSVLQGGDGTMWTKEVGDDTNTGWY